MAQQTINIGSAPNDGTGDPLRTAFDKANDNFTELYAGLTGLLDFKGATDCSANPNYPTASKGDYYVVSVAGKIGGASGVSVQAGDSYFATADNAGGTQAGVGSSWVVIQGNITPTVAGGNLIGLADPSAVTFLRVNADNTVDALSAAAFRTAIGAGTGSGSGDLLAANNLSDVASPATARTNLGVGAGDSPQFAGINVGHASDTTLSRASAGDLNVEGNLMYRAGGTDVPVADGGTGASTASAARSNLGLGTAAVDDRATAAQVQAGTANKVVEADVLVASAAPQTLTDGATVNWDMSLGYNAKVTIAGNRTLAVSNPVLGMTYSLGVIQDGTGSRTMTWPASFDWGTTGAPTLTTTASKRDRITLFCTDASTPKFDAFLSGKGFS